MPTIQENNNYKLYLEDWCKPYNIRTLVEFLYSIQLYTTKAFKIRKEMEMENTLVVAYDSIPVIVGGCHIK